MSETDERAIKLLEEIRDNLHKQASHSSACEEYAKKTHEAYKAQLAEYQKSQNIYRQSQEQYRGESPKSRKVGLVFLGIIAVSLVLNLIFRLAGK